MAKQIIELQGNIFEEKSRFRMSLDFPHFINPKITFTNDRISRQPFNLVNIGKGKKWYSVKWISHLRMYLLRELEFIRYEEKHDIRYEWKYKKNIKA